MPAFFDSNRGNFKPVRRHWMAKRPVASRLHHILYCALAAIIRRPIMARRRRPPEGPYHVGEFIRACID
jgi:hypothetical protein